MDGFLINRNCKIWLHISRNLKNSNRTRNFYWIATANSHKKNMQRVWQAMTFVPVYVLVFFFIIFLFMFLYFHYAPPTCTPSGH